ncbi:MAG: S1 RNA-binding domain-containing protein, partial [Myxococcota bacterium]
VSGEVTKVAEFGAFVKLEDGVEGLIYNSELASERVENPSDVVKEGETVTALITKVDPVEQKISLSIRALTDKEQRVAIKKLATQQSQSQATTLGDLLASKLAEKAQEEEGDESTE